MKQDEKHVRTVAEFARALGCTPQHVYNEAARGNVRLKKFGGKTIVLDDPAEFLAQLPDAQVGRGRRRKSAAA